MPTSQNGYSAGDLAQIEKMAIPGAGISLPVRRGPAGQLLVAAAARWHVEVEPLVIPGCWGYSPRKVIGSNTVLSNHASGTAIDLNAPKHPLGTPITANFTAAQIAAVRRIVDDARGALRWGGDYGTPSRGGVAGSRVDGMHLEIDAAEAACAAALPYLNGSPPSASALLEEDAMSSIKLIADAPGNVRGADGVEAGAGSQLASRAFLAVGSTWGNTEWVLTALSADAAVLKQWKPVRTDNNHTTTVELPAGTRSVTVEGTGDTHAVPWARSYMSR